jgi:NAD(P)-dependent dehydrogenase (short-subunit alcohol dehydrogenase family)
MSRVALVTGARSGIGHAIARQFLAEGWQVAVTGRNLSTLSAVFQDVSNENIYCLEADSRNLYDCRRIVLSTLQQFGRLDCLVNNVGGGVLNQTTARTTMDQFNDSHLLNVSSVFFTTQAAIPALTASEGSVVNLSSVLGSRPVAGLGPYCMHKAAVEMFTKTAAVELAPKGVRVNCIQPSVTETDFHTNAGMTPEVAKVYYEGSAALHPLGRIGTCEDIAMATTFLADSTKSGFITGTVLAVDGGRLLTMATGGAMAAKSS